MARSYKCDNCGKMIDGIHITLRGYKVFDWKDVPHGYGISVPPEDFCSFSCISDWALRQQKLLDEYIKMKEALATQPE